MDMADARAAMACSVLASLLTGGLALAQPSPTGPPGRAATRRAAAVRAHATAPSMLPATAAVPASQLLVAAQGHVRVDEPQYDFGQAWAGEPVAHTFELTNTGQEVLNIQNVRTTCGCTTTGQWDRQVEPGQTWKLSVRFDSTGRPGRQHKGISVYGDDVTRPIAQFTLTGEVRERFSLSPTGSVVFGTLKADSAEKHSLTISSQLDQPVTLSEPTVDSDLYRVSLRETEPGKQYVLEVETAPPLKGTANRATVTIQTDLKEQPQLKVQVIGYLQPRIDMVPRTLMVPQPLMQDLRRRLILRSTDGTRIHADEVQVSPPDLTAEIQTVSQDQEYHIWVTIPKGLQLPPQGGTVTVLTDNPDYFALTATVRGFRAVDTRPAIRRAPATQNTRPVVGP